MSATPKNMRFDIAKGLGDSVLADTDDIVAVLRGQLYVEAMLTAMLEERYIDAGPMIAEVGFAGKIRHARRIGLINKPMANCLMVLAQIRNSFAHLPIKDTLTNDDDEELREAVAKLAFARDFEINHGDSRSGMETRRSIVMVFMALFFQHNDLKLRVRPNANGPGSEVAVTDNSRSDGLPPSPRGRL